jgi:hypothetical protein
MIDDSDNQIVLSLFKTVAGFGESEESIENLDVETSAVAAWKTSGQYRNERAYPCYRLWRRSGFIFAWRVIRV